MNGKSLDDWNKVKPIFERLGNVLAEYGLAMNHYYYTPGEMYLSIGIGVIDKKRFHDFLHNNKGEVKDTWFLSNVLVSEFKSIGSLKDQISNVIEQMNKSCEEFDALVNEVNTQNVIEGVSISDWRDELIEIYEKLTGENPWEFRPILK